MRVAIMQPYFLPYIGYYQLIDSVDVFVIYDNIKYTKKGWINRNRYLQDEKAAYFTIPLAKGSDSLNIIDRKLDKNYNFDKIWNKVHAAYKKAPYYQEVSRLFYEILYYEDSNLFGYLHHSIQRILEHLNIDTEVIISSTIERDNLLKGQMRVLNLCKTLGATEYYNLPGGRELYSKEAFCSEGIDLRFLVPDEIEYAQFGNNFVPKLSILDILMFNNAGEIRRILSKKTVLST